MSDDLPKSGTHHDDMLAENVRSLSARAALVTLFPAERRIVEQLLAIPPYELGTMTSSDLSERSGASRSSIDRLSRKLGFQGLKDMRRAVLIGEETKRVGALPSAARRLRSSGEIARHVMSAIAARSDAMANILADSQDLDLLLDWLLAAKRIELFGAGESAATCSAIHTRLIRLGLPINFNCEHHTQVTAASCLTSEDAVIAISHSGATRSTIWAAKVAKQSGAKLAAVTGAGMSRLAKLADLVIRLPVGQLPGSAEVVDRVVTAGLAEVIFLSLVARDSALQMRSVHVDDIFGEDRL